jgi:hypothetical protein
MDLVEVLSFLFMLSTMELGRVRPAALLRLGEVDLVLLLGILDGEPKRYSTGNVGGLARLWPYLAAQSNASVICVKILRCLCHLRRHHPVVSARHAWRRH